MHWILVGFLIGLGLILALLASVLLMQPETWAVIGIAVGGLALWAFAPNLPENLIKIPMGLIGLSFLFYMGYCIFVIGRGLWEGIVHLRQHGLSPLTLKTALKTALRHRDHGMEDGYLHSRSKEPWRTVEIGPEMWPLLVRAIHNGLQELASMSDGADGDGFNKEDSAFGKDLAAREFLTQSQAAAGRKLAIKYGRQLDPDLLEIIKKGRP